jgi:membrane-bound metal-dependent hydrolase YbcI (DUF457 family)
VHPYPHWPFLSDPSHPTLSVAWAGFVHGCISLLVVAPIVWSSRHRERNAAVAFIAGSVVDLDHVFAVGSLDPSRLEHIAGGRPVTHSVLFGLVLSLLVLWFTRRIVLAWSVFAVIVSHLLFDAAGGSERWLYPLEHPQSAPWLSCPIGIIALTVISWMLVQRRTETVVSLQGR